MAGPWEKYQEAPQQGPWSQYADNAPADPAENIGSRVSNLIEGGKLALKAPLVGLGQIFGKVSPEEYGAYKAELEANANKPGGVGGQVLGTTAISAPMALIPGGIPAQAAAGAAYGLTQPAEDWKERGLNSAVGGVGGAGGQLLGRGLGAVGNKLMTAAEQKAALEAAKNAPIDNTIKEALGAGYRLPPSMVKPTLYNQTMESISGKAATAQEASRINQEVTDNLARRAAGLGENDPITPQTLQAARDVIKKPYQEIAARGLQKDLDELDALRASARDAWKEYERQGTRSALNDFKQFKTDAEKKEAFIEQVLKFKQRPDLIDQFREARQKLAINHDVESALIEGGGTIDARVIAKKAQRGDPLTGDLATIGNFANNFPKAVQPDKMVGSQGVSKMAAGLSTLLAGGAGAAIGPGGIAAGALPFIVPPLARARLLSPGYQAGLIPSYGPGLLPQLPGKVAPLLGPAGSAGAVGLLQSN